MGKTKGSARRKGGKDATKVASKATSTLSKRQEKKSQVRKAAARERKGALLSQLETRKAADAAAARGPLLGGSLGLDLDDALAEVHADRRASLPEIFRRYHIVDTLIGIKIGMKFEASKAETTRRRTRVESETYAKIVQRYCA